jgi:hypothetical protein
MRDAGILGRCGLFVENPQDPAEYLEDGLERDYRLFWEWVETKDFMEDSRTSSRSEWIKGHWGIRDPTPMTLMTNIAQLRELDGIKASAAGVGTQ